MNQPDPPVSRELSRIVHPWVVLASLLTYALGGGIAHYLGSQINWITYLVGQSCVIILLISSYLLREYFDMPPAIERKPEPGEPPVLTRTILGQISATFLTVGAVLTVLLLANHQLNPQAFLILGLAFILAIAYAIPPLRLAHSGYGELASAILVVNLVPAFAFLLQSGEYHRLLALVTLPMTFLYLAAYLAISLQSYAGDVRKGRKNMLVRLGWQRGMMVHNMLILLGFLVMGTAALAGLPWGITWPGLLGLPLGLFQIWQMASIANGARPRWQLLMITSGATLALTAYFVNFALWTG
jgi:1,4-dihydroxy-2-naphthoate octaprenyltransferase